jgi:hypothetical protein
MKGSVMKNVLFAVSLMTAMCFSLMCGDPEVSGQPSDPSGLPIDYLPTKAGTVLKYHIKIWDTHPLKYEEITWPQGSGEVVSKTRGKLLLAVKGEKEFELELKVKGPAEKQGPLQYPIGVELTVEKDSLGVYEGAKQIFWAASNQGAFICNEVVVYPPDSPRAPKGPWGSWANEGFAMGVYFFGEKPGTEISKTKSPTEKLVFAGVKNIPEIGNCLLFVRTVAADADKDIAIGAEFREYRYFVQGKGLVYLEQKVLIKESWVTSMTWTLEQK